MAREDEEAFSRFVVFESMTFQDAFIESRPGPRPERSNSARVKASRMAKRTEVRRAYLAKQKAHTAAPVAVSTDPQSILRLMDQVSAALLQASKTAKAHGADRLANSIKQSLVRHVGRHSRVSQRVENPGAVRTADEGDVERLARRILDIEP